MVPRNSRAGDREWTAHLDDPSCERRLAQIRMMKAMTDPAATTTNTCAMTLWSRVLLDDELTHFSSYFFSALLDLREASDKHDQLLAPPLATNGPQSICSTGGGGCSYPRPPAQLMWTASSTASSWMGRTSRCLKWWAWCSCGDTSETCAVLAFSLRLPSLQITPAATRRVGAYFRVTGKKGTKNQGDRMRASSHRRLPVWS